jgi:hypothetical protein
VIECQMGSQHLNGNDARALLRITWGWLESIGSGRPREEDVQELADELRQAGYGPLEEA